MFDGVASSSWDEIVGVQELQIERDSLRAELSTLDC